MTNKFFMPPILPEEKRQRKDEKSRLNQYIRWLNLTGHIWYRPQLDAFRDYLIGTIKLQPPSLRAYLATVRGRYLELYRDPNIREYLNFELHGNTEEVSECLIQIQVAAHVHIIHNFIRPQTRSYPQLTMDQCAQFLNAPNGTTLRGLRDRALFASTVFMGLRETELRSLEVADVCLTGGEGEIGIHVPDGPASSERFVPFYSGFPVKNILEAWLSRSGIKEGPVFRGFYRYEKSLRNTTISLQAIEDIFAGYPISGPDGPLHIRPIDLRIFYAQLLYDLDYSLYDIAQNLGIRIESAVKYIGTRPKGGGPYSDDDWWELATQWLYKDDLFRRLKED